MVKKSTLSDHMKQIIPAVHAAVDAAVKSSSPKAGPGPKPAGIGGPGPVVNPKFIVVTVGFEVD
ncbi:hypothetical protein [Rudaea sp.]|jgi:hypothetical protein|uniref:hypothetical protein n=1 Tax=Rudaea sp. TaxID=2136325 RepID=UPI002F923FFB